MSFKKKLLAGVLAISPFAGRHAYQTQDEWLPPVKAFSYSIIEDLGMEETFDDLTGMSIDPNLRDYLGAVFLDLDSHSDSDITKQDILNLVHEMHLPPDKEIVDEFLSTDVALPEAPRPRNYLSVGRVERYPTAARDPPPAQPDPSAGVTVDEMLDLVIALRNKDGQVTDEELLRNLASHWKHQHIEPSRLRKELPHRPAHYWPRDSLLTVPHHILGALLSDEDVDELQATNAAKAAIKQQQQQQRQARASASAAEASADDVEMVELALTTLRKKIAQLQSKSRDNDDDEVLRIRLADLREEENDLKLELASIR